MFSFVKYLFIFCLLFTLGSCSIPEVKTSKKSYLVLASDFLYAKDSSLFANFEKQSNIKVKIKHLSADSILSHYKLNTYNSKFDGVLMYSSYTLNRFSKAKLLHPLPNRITDIPNGAKSPKDDWFVFGIDPYVFDFGKNEISANTYNELTTNLKWKPTLTKDESAAFFASVIHQFGRSNLPKSMNWLRSMQDHSVWTTNVNDTVQSANFTLSRHSKVYNKKTNFIIPNQGRLGAFYDGIGIAIVKHSAKYTEISVLMNYLLNPHFNQAITGKLFVFPYENPKSRSDFKFQNDYPTFFRCAPKEAAEEYRDMERILNKLDMKFPKGSK